MKLRLLFPIFLSVVIGGAMSAAAAPLSIKASLDSTHLLMGNITLLHLEVVQDKTQTVRLPQLSGESAPSGIVGVCGDSIELRTSIISDTVELGSGRLQVRHDIPLQAFDSGYYKLPEFYAVSGNDTAVSRSLGIKVIPVPNLTANDSIAPFAGVEEPEGRSWLDNIPDVIYYYWWILLVVAALIVLGWWIRRRLAQKAPVIPKRKEKQLTPYEEAMQSLRNLRERKLWEKGLEKEYFTELTDILRIYLQRRFGISAMEMTTGQILEILRNDAEIRDKRDKVRQVLDMADFVKFAKVRPLPADNVAAFDNVVAFVEQTAPQEQDMGKKNAGNNDTDVPESADLKKGGDK